MRVTEEEFIYIWRYFQYCCLPSIVLARYSYLDYIGDIREEKTFCRHGMKQAINRIGKYLEALPRKLMDVSSQNVRYMNILADNMEEQFEEDVEELHKAIHLTFRNAKWEHIECLTALHHISAMLQIATATFAQCCEDLRKETGHDAYDTFHVFNLRNTTERWEKIVSEADRILDTKRKSEDIDLNNLRCSRAVKALRSRLSDIETLRTAMRKSYPWSPNFREDIPYEESVDYLIVNHKKNDNGMDKDIEGKTAVIQTEQHYLAGA